MLRIHNSVLTPRNANTKSRLICIFLHCNSIQIYSIAYQSKNRNMQEIFKIQCASPNSSKRNYTIHSRSKMMEVLQLIEKRKFKYINFIVIKGSPFIQLFVNLFITWNKSQRVPICSCFSPIQNYIFFSIQNQKILFGGILTHEKKKKNLTPSKEHKIFFMFLEWTSSKHMKQDLWSITYNIIGGQKPKIILPSGQFKWKIN